MNIRCVITDDEPMARKGLQGYVEKINSLQLTGVFENAIDLNEFLKENKVDLIFLDIEMPYLSGIELLQTLQYPPKVIFTTAYEKYALKGYELEVIDYLLKPISFDRFLKAVNKAESIFDKEKKVTGADDFYIKTNGRLIRLFWKDILFIEGLENYITIYTQQDKHITHLTLKTVMASMPAEFLQVHKSALVNTACITGIMGNVLEIGPHQISISRGMKDDVLEKIVRNKMLKRE